MLHPAPPSAIEAHLAIGDGRSVALTDGAGGIDWLCWPRFDSDATFAELIGRGAGHFLMASRGAHRSIADYVGDTNVARTRFVAPSTSMTLLDAMTVSRDGAHERDLEPEHELLRVMSCEAGEGVVDVAVRVAPAFGRAASKTRIDRRDGTVRFERRGELLVLRASRPVAWHEEDGTLRCAVPLRAGERVAFALTYAGERSAALEPLDDHGARRIDEIVATWRAWANRARYDGPYRDLVVRSALALKLLCYAPSGAIIAAPTTSLPERWGGDRNWDYRFCWLRDAALTARALWGLGYEEEAGAFVSWLMHATRLTRPRLRILYDVFGLAPRAERELALEGYGGAQPVRIGNAAADQIQLDVYGEVIDAVAQATTCGRDPDHAERAMLAELGTYLLDVWSRPDQGIWEPREAPAHHVHSRVLCWVAFDRLLRLADDGPLDLLPSLRERFAGARSAIAHEVRSQGWSDALGSYTATLGGSSLDASLLLLSWYGFEDAASARMRATFAAVDRTLGLGRGLVRRNLELADDGAFVACAFWAAEHLARGGGSNDEARARFETLLGLAPPSGLFGEVVDASGRHLGNYPQGFSHLALINAALSLSEREARR